MPNDILFPGPFISWDEITRDEVAAFKTALEASDDFVWYAVELERPQAKMSNKNGDPSAALTHALRQISDWRDWLSRNLDYATRPRDRSGLNLTDIHPELDGMIVIGRDAEVDRRATALRWQRRERAHRVKIETYDWLLAQASDRLAGLEERARHIISQHPLLGLFDAIARNPRGTSPAAKAVSEVFGEPKMSRTSAVTPSRWPGSQGH